MRSSTTLAGAQTKGSRLDEPRRSKRRAQDCTRSAPGPPSSRTCSACGAAASSSTDGPLPDRGAEQPEPARHGVGHPQADHRRHRLRHGVRYFLMRGNIPNHYIVFLVVGVFMFDYFSELLHLRIEVDHPERKPGQSLSFPACHCRWRLSRETPRVLSRCWRSSTASFWCTGSGQNRMALDDPGRRAVHRLQHRRHDDHGTT